MTLSASGSTIGKYGIIGDCAETSKNYDEAEESFRNANALQRHTATFLELGEICVAQKNYEEAIDVYTEALEFTPDDPELLFRVGLCHAKEGDSFKAFECLGNALAHDPRSSAAILPRVPCCRKKTTLTWRS